IGTVSSEHFTASCDAADGIIPGKSVLEIVENGHALLRGTGCFVEQCSVGTRHSSASLIPNRCSRELVLAKLVAACRRHHLLVAAARNGKQITLRWKGPTSQEVLPLSVTRTSGRMGGGVKSL